MRNSQDEEGKEDGEKQQKRGKNLNKEKKECEAGELQGRTVQRK